MQRVILGRTGLEVSVAGLGCGGHSRLGQSYGHSFEQSVAIVRTALDRGVNFIDTAAAYGTEEIVGEALRSGRDQIVVSSKLGVVRPGTSPLGQEFLNADQFVDLAEQNLTRLGTDYIDVFHLHGVMPEQYDYCRAELVPALLKLRDQGKIRFLGLTERFIHDPGHQMMQRALEDDHWDVVMTGFNMINASARQRVLKRTGEKKVGALIMFAVRRALSQREATSELIAELVASGHQQANVLAPQDPLGFLSQPGTAGSVVEAAYRFCRHEPGAHVVLTGTGSVDHLKENLKAIASPQLPVEVIDQLDELFGGIDSVSGN